MKGAARVRRDQIDEKSLPPFLLPYTIARFHDRNFVLLEIEIVIAILGFLLFVIDEWKAHHRKRYRDS